MMKATRASVVGAAVCLSCTLALTGELSAEAGASSVNFEEQFTAFVVQSVSAYEAGNFEESLHAAESALAYVERSAAVAYNNICSAEMRLGAYERAIRACKKSLEFAPGYEPAQNNLEWIYAQVSERSPSAGAFLDLSLVRFWQGELDESIVAAKQALDLDPNSAVAHNNICVALAKGGKFDQAIRACAEALIIDPGYERAKNNLDWARLKQAEAKDGS
jgi:tetratricopeptide (TPR) repeat protein